MPQYRDISNPKIDPATIRTSGQVTALPDNITLAKFKARTELAAQDTSQDTVFTEDLLEVINEIAKPTSLGVNVVPTTWQLRVNVNQHNYIFLPRWNQVSLPTVTGYNLDGTQVETTITELGDWEKIPNIPLVKFSGPIPAIADFSYQVGYTAATLPDEIERLIYMQTNYRRTYPLGVGAGDRPMAPYPLAVQQIRERWQPLYDLYAFFLTYRTATAGTAAASGSPTPVGSDIEINPPDEVTEGNAEKIKKGRKVWSIPGGNVPSFTPTKQNLYQAIKAILQPSTNVTITPDDTDSELDISATGGGGVTLTKATNDQVDAETDDTAYMTVVKVYRAIARKVKAATKVTAGIVEIATNTEGDTGTDDTRAMTPFGVRRQTGAQVSSAEKTAGTETNVRRFSPKDVHDMVDEHAPAGGGTPRAAGTGLSLSGNTLNIDNPYTDEDETKLDSLFNFESSIKFTADFSTTPPSNDGSEIVAYTAGTPSDTNDVGQNINLANIVTFRLSNKHSPYNTNPSDPNTDVDAVDVADFVDKLISTKSNAVLIFKSNTVGGNNALSGEAAVYITEISKGTTQQSPQTPYLQFTGFTWGDTITTPDQGSTAVNLELRVAAPNVAGEVSGLAAVAKTGSYNDLDNKPTIPAAQIQSDWNQTTTTALDYIKNKPTIPDAEQIRIDEFIDDPATVKLGNYDIVDSITGTNPTGKIDATEGTGDPIPLILAITRQSKTTGSAGDNKAALEAINIGDQFLVHNTADSEYLFGTITSIEYQDGSGNTVTELPASNGQANFTYTLDDERGVDQYGQLTAGAGAFHYRRAPLARNLSNMDDPVAAAKTKLRAALPTGTVKTDGTLSAADRVLLDNFDEADLGDIVEWHDEHHTGSATLTGYQYQATGIAGNSPAGRVNDDGTNLNFKPLNNAHKASLKAKITAGKKITLWVSATRYTEYHTTGGINDNQGVLSVPYLSSTKNVVGTALAAGVSLNLIVENNIPARSELTTASFKGVYSAAHWFLMTAGGLDMDVEAHQPDTVPTQGSKMPVNSGVVYNAIQAISGSAINEVAEVSNPSIDGSWVDISNDTFGDTDFVIAQMIEESGDRVSLSVGPAKFGDISSTSLQAQVVSDVDLPQSDAQQNTTTTAITGTFVTFATSTAITPRASTSKFRINVKGVGGSISGQARGDIQIQRKIGSAGWATVSTLSKNYMFLADFGNPPFGWGPIEDSPNTSEAIQYRAQLRRNTSGAHSGSWNCEALFLTVDEVVSDPDTARVLRIRSNSSKLQYQLTGDWGSTTKLRVYKIANSAGALTDSEIGDKAFSNPPSDLTTTEKTAVRTAIGAGTGSGGGGPSGYGTKIATFALPTTATSGEITPTSRSYESGIPSGFANSGTKGMTVPGIAPVINGVKMKGIWAVAVENTTVRSDTFISWGPGNIRSEQSLNDFSDSSLHFDNIEKVDVRYEHSATDGSGVSIYGDGLALPANAKVEFYLSQ